MPNLLIKNVKLNFNLPDKDYGKYIRMFYGIIELETISKYIF